MSCVDHECHVCQVKQQVHEEMERKDGELGEVRRQASAIQAENTDLKQRLDKAEKTGTAIKQLPIMGSKLQITRLNKDTCNSKESSVLEK